MSVLMNMRGTATTSVNSAALCPQDIFERGSLGYVR